MARILKVLAALCGLLLLILAGLIFYITQLFDPNTLKPELEKYARQQGIALYLPGNISWQWYPYLGLTLQQVRVGDEALLAIEELSARVAIAPLLQRRVEVKELSVDGMQLDMRKDEKGVANWEQLAQALKGEQPVPEVPAAEAPASAVAEPEKQALVLAVERLRITGANVQYHDLATSMAVQLSDLELAIDNLSLAGDNFQLQHSTQLQFNDLPAIDVSIDGGMAVDLSRQSARLEGINLQLTAESRPLSLALEGNVALEPLAPDVKIKVAPFALRQWLQTLKVELPAMAASDALSSLALNARLKGKEGVWQIGNLAIQLDETRIKGRMSVAADGALDLSLNADQLDLDRYLPPPAEQPAGKATVASAPEQPLDLTALRELQAKLGLTIGQLQAAKMIFSDPRLTLVADGGQLQLTDFSSGFYQGQLSMKGGLDARKPQATVTARGQVTAVALQPLLKAVAEEERLSGLVSANWSVDTTGSSVTAWRKNIDASLDASAASLALAQVDLERSACELAALVNLKPAPELSWKGSTQLQDVLVQLAISGEQVNIRHLQAGVENLALQGKGKLNYADGSFEIPVGVKFTGTADDTRKCQVRERWRNQPLPLRCKGNLDALSARTCLPDHKRLDDLLREEVKGRVLEKLDQVKADDRVEAAKDKVEAAKDKAEASVKEKVQKKLDTEGGQILRDVLKR